MKKIFYNFKDLIYKNEFIRTLYEKTLLFLCKKVIFLEKNLANKIDMDLILKDQKIENDFLEINEKIKKLEIPNLTGGVNPSDQKIIFKIIRALGSKNVLEIGTHIGSSTVSIALAMFQKNEAFFLKTVDIRNVNDDYLKPWLEFKSKNSPKNNLKLIELDSFVEFKKSDSLNFLEKESRKYDFIFLDGSHRADHVYKEVSLALKLLSSNGLILLHDYYPSSAPIPGPNEAFQRINKENKLLSIYHLVDLPFVEDDNLYTSSLALIYKK